MARLAQALRNTFVSSCLRVNRPSSGFAQSAPSQKNHFPIRLAMHKELDSRFVLISGDCES
jgi:hypothetical protein